MQHNVSLPAWSDAPELVKDGVLHVSIHVPAWGATLLTFDAETWGVVSIHAPAWGATPAVSLYVGIFEFQSTLPRGERQYPIHIVIVLLSFQSTLPRGERLLLESFLAIS